ncbi:MAG TPA: TIGR03089 family protein [Mycobacteriales bacterium]|nr:TIGR03089 family protein [Mycobacteriales bacterium]
MRSLTSATAGLVGPRDPAQPLLTLRVPEGRVELSGATTANWVAKTANLLVDGYGGPGRVGVLLPLHWQSVCVLLGAVASGAEVVVGRTADDVEDADLVLCTVDDAAALPRVPDVLVAPVHPLGAPPAGVPAGLGDYAREVPSYGDHWGGPDPSAAHVLVDGAPVAPVAGAGEGDRVLVTGALPDALPEVLGALAAGAAVVLVPDPDAVDLDAVRAEERTTRG